MKSHGSLSNFLHLNKGKLLVLFFFCIIIICFFKFKTNSKDNEEYDYLSNSQYSTAVSLFNECTITECNNLFLGDSITARCDFNKLFNKTDIINRGIGSDVTEGVLNRLDQVYKLNPKKIFLLIGINDLALHIKEDTIIRNYSKILYGINKNLPDTMVYVESIYPVAASQNIPNESIVRINKRIDKLVKEYENCKYIDVYTSLVSNDVINAGYSDDGIHLNDEGYMVIKSILQEYVE